MRRVSLVVVAVIALTSLSACKLKKEMDQASLSASMATKGTTELLKQTAEDDYTAPADGKLTEGQIQMYLKVRERETAIAKVAKNELQQHADKANAGGEKSLAGVMEGFKGLGSAADLLTADIRAAKDLGFNTQEYLWVKGQVLAASGSVMTEKLQQSMSAQMEASYAEIKKQQEAATDEATKKAYADMLAGFKTTKQELAVEQQKADPAIAYNRDLLSKHENALNAFTAEMSKFEDKDGDAKKSMDQWQKDLDTQAKGQTQ